MVDRRRIVGQWREGKARVLVTLVRAEGSSYRRPGAHLLIGSEGAYTGTISGGCLEAEVVRKAAWKTQHGAVVETYSTLFDDTAEIPYGLGCGGIVDLLLEPVDTPEAQALLSAMQASLEGTPAQVATWLPSSTSPLRRAVFTSSGALVFSSSTLTPTEISLVRDSLATGPDSALPSNIYIESLQPPQRLLLFGAGDDARPLSTMAALLGWSVLVCDGRPRLARPERFPEAERVLTTTALAEIAPQPQDAAVLMTHSYEQDRACLQALLGLPPHAIPGYIGLLGARHRSSLLVSEAAAALGLTVEECCQRLWAPVGLDLGGDGPEAIALAVIAEVQSWVQGRLARPRRLSASEVAEQISRGGASAYLQAKCPTDLAHP